MKEQTNQTGQRMYTEDEVVEIYGVTRSLEACIKLCVMHVEQRDIENALIILDSYKQMPVTLQNKLAECSFLNIGEFEKFLYSNSQKTEGDERR